MNITFEAYKGNIEKSKHRYMGFNGAYVQGDKAYTWHQVDTEEFEYVESVYCARTCVMSYSGSK